MTEEIYYIDKHIYQDTISVVFTNDLKASIKAQCEVKNVPYKNLKPGNASAIFCNVHEKNCSGRWLLFDINKIEDSIIVHECVHVAMGLLYERGLKLSPDTEEAYAYLIQWLFNQVKGFHKDFIKQKKELKKKLKV